MESAARPVRAVAHDLHEVQPLGSQRSTHRGVRTAHRSRSSGIGLHDGQGPSRRSGGFDQARSPGYRSLPRGLTTKIHMVAANARTAILFALSPGQDHDVPHGRRLLKKAGPPEQLRLFLVADRAYERTPTRQLALGYTPHIPPKADSRNPRPYDPHIYKRRNESNGSSAGSTPTDASSSATTNST